MAEHCFNILILYIKWYKAFEVLAWQVKIYTINFMATTKIEQKNSELISKIKWNHKK